MNPPNGEVKAVGRGRGPWRADQNIELRRPQISSTASELSSSGDVASKDEVSSISVAIQSKLSVNAKEFVPKGQTFTPITDNSRSFGSSSNAEYNYYGQQEENYEDDLSSEEWVIHHLNEVIKSLTQDPGNFDQLVKPLLDELLPLLAVEETVENVVGAIINQAIAERNFRYSGARLFNLLNNQKEPGASSAFRRIMLTKLCDEHGKIENTLKSNPDKLYGFVHFLAEVYIQLELTKGLGHRIAVLGDALLHALKVLIQIPSVDNIKNTCDILKLSGRMLEADQSEAESFFSDLQKITEDESVGTRVKGIINNILKLRSDNWGHAVSSENAGSSRASSVSSVVANEGVYYGPDHQALTAEEYKFLDESCEKEEKVAVGAEPTVWDPEANENENAEIMAAFLEFANQKPRS